MRQTSHIRTRARDFVRAAQQHTPDKFSAPALTHVLVTTMREDVEADSEVSQLVAAIGWGQLVREAIKGFGLSPAGSYETLDGDGGEDAEETAAARWRQVLLFPERCREDIREVNRAAVFVPSRAQHVPLTPADLSPDEMREAGGYLLQMGQDCLVRGRALLRVAAAMGGATPQG